MTQSKIKAIETALLKYNAMSRRLIEADILAQSTLADLKDCLKRGEEALKVEVTGRS